MRVSLIAAALLAAACQTHGAPEAPTAQRPIYNLIDLTDDFGAFHDRTQGMEASARVATFKREFNARLPGFYDTARMEGLITPERYDQHIADALEMFPQQREAFEATAAAFEDSMASARAPFIAAFPDVQHLGDIYLLHSLGEMDGGTRKIDGQTYMIVGADVMARIYEPGETTPFFHHELFHFYHTSYFPECEAFWCSLWREGLATYVAEQLNPGADDEALSLTLPRPIRPEVDANLQYAICAVQVRLDSESMGDYAPFFYGSSSLEGLPPRAGYYVGYLIARQAGRTRSVQELARLSHAEARPLVEAALGSLATCPAN